MKRIKMLYDGQYDEKSIAQLNTFQKNNLMSLMTIQNETIIPMISGDYVYIQSVKVSDSIVHEIYFWRQSP